MGPGRRAYDLMRGYVNREWERIQGVEQGYAEKELAEAMEKPTPMKRPAANEPAAPTPASTVDRSDRARRILGVTPTAGFEEIRKAFQTLNRRSDPVNFPDASEARTNAAEIQKRVQWAYGVLTENMDPTEKRFKSLEID